MRRAAYVRVILAALLAGCAWVSAVAQAPAVSAEKLNVVASFSILADMVRNVGGERITLTTLVGPNADAHVYSPSPADAKALAAAQLVFVNGLGFEGWMARLVKSSASKATVVVAAREVPARRGGAEGDQQTAESDPHVWQSVANARIEVGTLRDALIAADPAGRDFYGANAAAYLAKLEVLDTEIRQAVASLPPERRKVISTHDAFAYFQQEYGIAFLAPLGVSTEAEASARDVARIIRQIRQQAIPAVFLENVTDPRLMRRIAEEGGARIGGTLYSDALTGPEGDAPTYIEMMRHNLRTLIAALRE